MMLSHRIKLLFFMLSALFSVAEGRDVIVADGATHEVLASASVFSANGSFLGVSNARGRLPFASERDFPLTVRYLGYKEVTVGEELPDTIFLHENPLDLSEVVVESKAQKALHIMAYVREYSTLSTYTDTIFLFREKTVDFMLPSNPKSKFRGWRQPRVLYSKSYYRFMNECGLDSVSDACNQYFSWADWVGISPEVPLPQTISDNEMATDTVFGKYGPTETWVRNGDRLKLSVDVLVDTTSRRWVPNLSVFFRNDLDYDMFKLQINYENIASKTVGPLDITAYSFNIESNGRGRNMFMFNKIDQPIYVTTYGEVYVLDKEFITIAEARKWEKGVTDGEEIGIIEAYGAPELQPAIAGLIERVNSIDREEIRLALQPDQRLAGHRVVRNFGQEMLSRIRNMLGIARIRGMMKQKKKWKDFRRNNAKDFNIQRFEEATPRQ